MSLLVALESAIKRHGLSAHAERIIRFALPCIGLTPERVIRVDSLPPNGSYFAGPVYLPEGQSWPLTDDGRPLIRLVQIRLSDVATLDSSGLLPSRGLLSFWYDALEQPWGFDPKDRSGFRVAFEPNEDIRLTEIGPPMSFKDTAADFAPCRLTFTASITIPYTSWSDYQDERAGLIDLPGYDGLVEDLDMPFNSLLGNPTLVQNPMEEECQFASNGIYCGNASISDSRAKSLASGTGDWILLLQLGSDEDAPNWMWGDLGFLYFWIRRQDLVKRNFSNCWVVLQCS